MSMTLKEAYAIFETSYPGMYSAEAIETPESFIFNPRPFDIGPNEPYITGTIFPAVRKDNAKIVEFDITESNVEMVKRYRINGKRAS